VLQIRDPASHQNIFIWFFQRKNGRKTFFENV
jgi:hypothetical protein